MHGGCPLLLCSFRVVQSLLGNAADVVEKLANFHLELIAALLNSIQDVSLNSRAVHFNQVFKKSMALFPDHVSGADQTQHKVSKPSQWRCRLGNLDENP